MQRKWSRAYLHHSTRLCSTRQGTNSQNHLLYYYRVEWREIIPEREEEGKDVKLSLTVSRLLEKCSELGGQQRDTVNAYIF